MVAVVFAGRCTPVGGRLAGRLAGQLAGRPAGRLAGRPAAGVERRATKA